WARKAVRKAGLLLPKARRNRWRITPRRTPAASLKRCWRQHRWQQPLARKRPSADRETFGLPWLWPPAIGVPVRGVAAARFTTRADADDSAGQARGPASVIHGAVIAAQFSGQPFTDWRIFFCGRGAG